jgi:hypothetical protein
MLKTKCGVCNQEVEYKSEHESSINAANEEQQALDTWLSAHARCREAVLGEPVGEAHDPGAPHLIRGEFQSDKYPTTPRGKVPLSCKDPTAQDLLWEYAQRRRAVDAEFAADLEQALRNAAFEPPGAPRSALLVRLCQLFAEGGAETWMRSPQHVLGGRSPDDCIRSGEVDKVLDVLDQLELQALEHE